MPSTLLFQSSFDDPTALEWEKEFTLARQWTQLSHFEGRTNVMRFYLEGSDPPIATGPRVEFRKYSIDVRNGTHFFSFKQFIPGPYVNNGTQEHVAQWQGEVDGSWTSPAAALVVRDAEYVLEGAYFPEGTSGGVRRITFFRRPIVTNQWVDWKFKFTFLPTGGECQVWLNGEQVANWTGTNGDSHRDAVGLKIGMYKSAGWGNGVASRTIYYDEVKIWKQD